MTTIHYFVISIIFVFVSCSNNIKSISVLNKEQSTIEQEAITKNLEKKYFSTTEISTAVLMKDLLPANHSKKGDIDYTVEIQNILNEHRSVVFPPYPLLINKSGLKILSNSKLYFLEKSLLKFASSNEINYAILHLNNVDSVSIYSPRLNGDRNRRLNPENLKGEWGMGLSIRSSHNINILNPKITDCWGDGIYIGAGNPQKPNSNIIIDDAVLVNNRRNGISIVSAASITINNALISRTNGTRPGAGIDIEPNNNNDTIGEINLNNIHTVNNENYGMLIALSQLAGAKLKKITISINNHVDEQSNTAFRFAGYPQSIRNEAKAITGIIKVENANWKNNKVPLLFQDTKNMFPKVIFQNTTVYNNNNAQSLSEIYVTKEHTKLSKKQVLIKD